ncbi:MAG: lipoprotein insertase outer membrane protein LolB [Vibrio sp.]
MHLHITNSLKKWCQTWLPTLALLVFLTACSSVQDDVPATTWQQHQTQLQNLTQYQASGKIAYRDLHKRQGLNFSLNQSPQLTRFKLFTFIGQTVLTVEITPQGTLIVDQNGEEYRSSNASELVEQLAGISIPVAELSDWIKGLPTGADSQQLNAGQRIAQFTKQIDHQDWKLTYQSYQQVLESSIPALGMPKNLVLRQGQTELKIAITHWSY